MRNLTPLVLQVWNTILILHGLSRLTIQTDLHILPNKVCDLTGESTAGIHRADDLLLGDDALFQTHPVIILQE